MKCGKISQIVLVITGIAMMSYGAVRGEAVGVAVRVLVSLLIGSPFKDKAPCGQHMGRWSV